MTSFYSSWLDAFGTRPFPRTFLINKETRKMTPLINFHTLPCHHNYTVRLGESQIVLANVIREEMICSGFIIPGYTFPWCGKMV